MPIAGRQTLYRVALGLLALSGIAAVLSVGGPHAVLQALIDRQDELRTEAARLGAASALLFIAAYALLMLLLWIPAWPCSVIGGFLFGPWWGAGYAVAGATAGATLVFLLARRGGFGQQAARLRPLLAIGLAKDALLTLLALRLVPVMPFTLLNIGAAVVGVPAHSFILATSIGILPSSLVYAGFGAGLAGLGHPETALSDAALLPRTLLWPLLGLAALSLVPVIGRLLRARRRGDDGNR